MLEVSFYFPSVANLIQLLSEHYHEEQRKKEIQLAITRGVYNKTRGFRNVDNCPIVSEFLFF